MTKRKKLILLAGIVAALVGVLLGLLLASHVPYHRTPWQKNLNWFIDGALTYHLVRRTHTRWVKKHRG